MDLTSAVPIIDKASTASFQWLFVAVLALFLWFSYMVFRHLVMQATELTRQSRQDSDAFQKILMEMNARSVERTEKHSAVIAENSFVISQNKIAFDRINNTLSKP